MIARFRVDRLHLKLGFIISTVVIGALGTGFYVSYQYYEFRVLGLVKDHATIQGSVVAAGLEHSMMRDDEELIRGIVDQYAVGSSVERVMIVDREGEVQYSSVPEFVGTRFTPDEPTCQVCHVHELDVRSDTVELEIDGVDTLRTVLPFQNRTECQECHEEEHRINGVLLVDVPIEPAYADVERAMRPFAAGTGLMAMFVLGSIAFVFRRLVLRRLYRFQTVAHAIASGDLGRRVPEEGKDAITDIERQFNQMADSIVGLLAEVEDQRAHLEKIMSSVDDGLVVLDDERRIIAVNGAFEDRNGTDLVGLHCCNEAGYPNAGLCSREGEPSGCLVLPCLESGRASGALRTFTMPDGRTLHDEIRTSPVRVSGDEVKFVVQLWRDISDRRAAEARLADTQRMASLGMLASGFSHELNTPLASIGTCLDGIARILAAADDEEDDEQADVAREYAQIALTEVQRCGAITRQFLQLARGKSVETRVIDIEETMHQVVRLVSPTARQQGVAIEVGETADGVHTVVANPPSVQQVLLNLILNAVEISERGQAVSVRLEDHGDHRTVVVEDRAGGIASADVGQVFEPFFSRRQGGTGLGLFVSLNLAHAWGGEIRLHNEPGLGARFDVTFPQPPADDEQGA